MFIVLHCGGIAFNGDTIHQRSLGGSESAAYHLARELAARGHRVRVFTRSQEQGEFEGVTYLYAGNESQQFPLGDMFHAYASQTPHDVLIVQRHPLGLMAKYACKQAYLWLHDLVLARNKGAYDQSMWQTTGIFCVSDFHKEQAQKILGIPEGVFLPITNGVDPHRFLCALELRGRYLRAKARDLITESNTRDPAEEVVNLPTDEFALLYSSRPERGLEALVRPGGIMDKLKNECANAHLYVCGYEHDVPEMNGYYDQLKAWAKERGNVTMLGHLTQAQLADVMKSVQLHVYPTMFEEVSCITAMECMHAGLPQLTSKHAALPETCKGAGVILVKPKDEKIDEQIFVTHIKRLARNGIDGSEYKELVERQKKCAAKFTWEKTADQVEGYIDGVFSKATASVPTVLRHCIRYSDILLARRVLDQISESDPIDKHPIVQRVRKDMENYTFINSPEAHREHYAIECAKYYDGPEYQGPEDSSQSPRYRATADVIAAGLDRLRTRVGSSDGGVARRLRIIDVGCAHGHYAVALARRFPEVDVVGLDVSARAVQEAERCKAAVGVDNVSFREVSADVSTWSELALKGDLILMGEVLEHVIDPTQWVDNVMRAFAEDHAEIVLTTPSGPWEYLSYRKKGSARFHVSHFERADLYDMFGGFAAFEVTVVPNSVMPTGELLGWYVTQFAWDPGKAVEPIDYDRKRHHLMPHETMTLGMIVRNAEATIRKTLNGPLELVDEIVIGLDPSTTDRTAEVLKLIEQDVGLWPIISVATGPAPLVDGFDVARNATLERASCDWYMWLDADEDISDAWFLHRLKRRNPYNGYCLPQHHFAVKPAGVLMTDLPTRIFRTDKGIRFLGCIHEHPELGDNEGVGTALLIQDVPIAHHGYYTEDIRRARFQRNFELMVRDRKTNPGRKLGKFLWIRDLAHMMTFTLERTGGITNDMRNWAMESIALYSDMLRDGDLRLCIDALQYYSTAVRVMGGGVEFALKLDVQRGQEAHADRSQEVRGLFADRAHIEALVQLQLKTQLGQFDTKYW